MNRADTIELEVTVGLLLAWSDEKLDAGVLMDRIIVVGIDRAEIIAADKEIDIYGRIRMGDRECRQRMVAELIGPVDTVDCAPGASAFEEVGYLVETFAVKIREVWNMK